MIRGDGPQEPRAEIIEIANRPLPPPAAARRGPERPDPKRRGGISLGRHRTAISLATVGLLAGVALVLVGPILLTARHPEEVALPAIFPATAGGLAVIDVATANVRESSSSDPTELAVGGWYNEVRNPGPCYPADPLGSPCPAAMTATLRSTADPTFAADGTPLPDESEVSALRPIFVDPVPPPDLPAGGATGGPRLVQPTPLVLIGHFHDDRAGSCPAGAAQSVVCGSAFVVDAVADLAGVVRAPGLVAMPGIRLSPTSVVASIRGQLQPGAYVLEFGPVDWLANPSAFSPAEYSPDAPLTGPTVWLIRGYLNGLASWMAIDDATEQVWGPLALPALATPRVAGIPKSIDGLQVQSVASALQARAGCCQLVAIGGYLSSDAPEGCPLAPAVGPGGPCSDTHLVLIDQPGTVLQANDQTFTYDLVIPPGDPSIAPTVVPGTGIPDPWADAATLAARLGPREVVLVGAFGDPRAPGCPDPANRGACDRAFVVDQLAWIEGVAEGPSVAIEPGIQPVRTAEEIGLLAGRDQKAGSTTAIVSLIATARRGLGAVVGVTPENRSNGDEVVWVVRVVVSVKGAAPESQFLLIDDRTAEFEATG